MKTLLYSLLLFPFIFHMACEDRVPQSAHAGKYLSISPTIVSYRETKASAGAMYSFVPGDEIGLYVTDGSLTESYAGNSYHNIRAAYGGTSWTLPEIAFAGHSASVYGYYPYQEGIAGAQALAVDLHAQTDYLYSGAVRAAQDQGMASLEMKHALTLVSVVIKKNDYQYEGKVTEISLDGVYASATMDIATGLVTPTGEKTVYKYPAGYIIDDYSPSKSSLILIPMSMPDNPASLTVTVDGCDYSFDIPGNHRWYAGYEYTYTVHLFNAMGVYPNPGGGEISLDIDYWSAIGKDDAINLVAPPPDDVLRVNTNFLSYGKTLVRGEGKIFGVALHNYSDRAFEGRIRFALFQGERIIEQYPAYTIPVLKGEGRWDGYRMPCFVTAPQGRYQLRALFQEKGSDNWFIPSFEDGTSEVDWEYILQDATDVPALTAVRLAGEKIHENLFFFVELNENFMLQYYLSNRGRKALHGEIRAVWERSFGEFYNIAADDGNTWSEEIGRAKIDLAEGQASYQGEIPCQITQFHALPKRYVPIVHLYYKADGSDKWLLMRHDCDFLFTQIKGVEDLWAIDENGNYTHDPSVGENTREYQTCNYAYILLKE